jgi:hypothetical protein
MIAEKLERVSPDEITKILSYEPTTLYADMAKAEDEAKKKIKD